MKSLGSLLCVALFSGWTAAEPQATANEQPTGDLEPLVVGRDFHASDPQLAELATVLLEENPEIRSARSRWRAKLEQVPQASSLPDPRITYRYFAETPETRVGPQKHGLELSQGVPWFGKRSLQAERAQYLVSGVGWNVVDLERALVAALKRSYFEVAYLREALAVNAEEAALLRRFESIALVRYSTGQGFQQSVIKVQTDISRLGDQATSLRQRLDAALRRIGQLIGREETSLTSRRIPLDLVEAHYDRGQLEDEALRDHPDVRALGERINADGSRLRRSRLDSRPDFRFGLGYVAVGDREDSAGLLMPPEDNGQDIFALTVSVNLPIYRRKIRAGIAEAEHSLQSNEHLLQQARDRLRFEIRESLLRLESLDERTRLYTAVIIPQAEESLGSAEAAYSTNRLDFLDLLDAERILFQVRLTYCRLLADYWIALADVELALGRSFPDGGNQP